MDNIRGHKFLFIKDIERCPYLPFEPEYDEWNRKDEERQRAIVEYRERLYSIANQRLSSDDPDVRMMAHFIIGFLDGH